MRIAIDVREVCRPQITGKGAWARGCLQVLLQEQSHQFLLLTDSPLPANFSGANVTTHLFKHGPGWHFRAAKFLKQEHPDVVLCPTSYLIPAILHQSVPCVPIVHDLIAFQREPHNRKAKILERALLPRALRRAAHVLCISESTKHDILERFPELPLDRLTSVFAGPFRASPPPRVAKPAGILCIATLCPRKNQLRLIRAYAALPEALKAAHPLLLAGGRGWRDVPILRLVEQTPGVQWLQYVRDSEYDALLSRCAVFAYPSLYEGFGLPVLDALQRGVPVLTSDRGSLQEVAGDAALLVDPERVPSMTDGLQRLLTDATLRERLAAAGPAQAAQYSWQRTATIVLDVLSRL
jgi:alpha-1,3-rhamnosyl/mannosyltransferase